MVTSYKDLRESMDLGDIDMNEAKKIIAEIKKRFSISRGSTFCFKNDVTIITLEDLEFALKTLIKEGKFIETSN